MLSIGRHLKSASPLGSWRNQPVTLFSPILRSELCQTQKKGRSEQLYSHA
jgi:hypothetical protein